DVGAREQARERPPLRELLPREALPAVERPVGFRMPKLAVEDHEPCVDALAPKREDVLPRDPREVDRAVHDPKSHVLGTVPGPWPWRTRPRDCPWDVSFRHVSHWSWS